MGTIPPRGGRKHCVVCDAGGSALVTPPGGGDETHSYTRLAAIRVKCKRHLDGPSRRFGPNDVLGANGALVASGPIATSSAADVRLKLLHEVIDYLQLLSQHL